MANLKEVRNRISSVDSTMQITSAMKMVAAAKLRKAQEAITNMRPYAEKLQEILEGLSGSLDTSENAYAQERETKRVLFVAITSNRGLCGAFNNNIIKEVNRVIQKDYQDQEVMVLSIGKKSFDFFKHTDYSASSDWGFEEGEKLNGVFDQLDFENVAPIAENVMRHFVNGHVDEVKLVYNQFKNAATQITTVENFLPIVPASSDEDGKQLKADYIFEPSKEEIVEDLIPRSLKTQFFKALLDSHASEHGARMTAMHQATDNASELLDDLRITYNKVRQAAITSEILEIVSGADALEG